MARRILITGGSGLVGSAFQAIQANYPDSEFISWSSRDCNLTDLAETKSKVAEAKPDAILHLAAISRGIGFSSKYPATLLRDNVLMNMSVLEAARVLEIPKTVMTLTIGMYPADCPIPITEDYIHLGPPHGSNYSYAFAKRLVEPSIRAYRAEYGMNVIGLAPNGIYGPNANYAYEDSLMISALIRRFHENKDSGERLTVWGDGSPLREYTYSEDMARAYMWCLDNYNEEQVLHVGTIEEHSEKSVAYMVAEIMEIDQNRIDFDTTKPAGPLRRSTDNSRFIGLSKFQYTPFRTGLEKSIEWFLERYPDPDKIRL